MQAIDGLNINPIHNIMVAPQYSDIYDGLRLRLFVTGDDHL
ncbi:hypothetical protein [Nostoc sp. UHCC 0252]|nr:hypothetical protein [Nostoc sp. UHCC 0252]MEA5603615.1 hypothetical protein [Nostoc sp. UHCC 0252]